MVNISACTATAEGHYDSRRPQKVQLQPAKIKSLWFMIPDSCFRLLWKPIHPKVQCFVAGYDAFLLTTVPLFLPGDSNQCGHFPPISPVNKTFTLAELSLIQRLLCVKFQDDQQVLKILKPARLVLTTKSNFKSRRSHFPPFYCLI